MFSVLIPLYNKAHTIIATIESVLAQSIQELEIVIVDDGSTDNGVDMIRNSVNDVRIRIVQQKNQGVSAARNRGVAEAKYDHIAFLDGDDLWFPEYLEKMKSAINLFPDAGMYCCAGYVKDRGGKHLRLAEKYKNRIQKIDFFENPGVFLHTSATVVDKASFNKTDGFPVGMKRNEDFALFFIIALHVPVVYCGFPLSMYVGEVEGQATKTPGNLVLSHIINRYNLVHKNYIELSQPNPTFIIYSKYELRHHIITLLRCKDYISIRIILDTLNAEIKQLFYPIELFLYSNKNLRIMALIEIYITKIRWRLRGYPKVQ